MKTYISILRGINVSGSKTIKMDELRKTYEKLGFKSVLTYVQSGNVIFTSESSNTKELENQITKEIEKVFGFNVPVIVLEKETLEEIINKNPFSEKKGRNPDYFYVTFLSEEPIEYDSKIIENKKQQDEEIAFSDKAVYIYCPNGYGKTKLNNTFIESKLKVTTTTRNWKTTNELFKIAQKLD
jgi:uncharacterized protein (DUF1697 family)